VGSVSIDDYDAAYRMTRHLIDLGHQRIGFVVGHPNQSCQRQAPGRLPRRDRGKGRGPVREPGRTGHVHLPLRPGRGRAPAGAGGAPDGDLRQQRRHGRRRVAVAHRLGLDVPGDLTVTGFDDTALATTIWPELTTVRQPIAEMAREAVQSLVRRVRALREGDEASLSAWAWRSNWCAASPTPRRAPVHRRACRQ
jgi:LacI family transcriptional regulator